MVKEDWFLKWSGCRLAFAIFTQGTYFVFKRSESLFYVVGIESFRNVNRLWTMFLLVAHPVIEIRGEKTYLQPSVRKMHILIQSTIFTEKLI